MAKSTHLCHPAGGSGIRGVQNPELNWVKFSVTKWKEHLRPQGGAQCFGSLSVGVVGLVLPRNLMVQTQVL